MTSPVCNPKLLALGMYAHNSGFSIWLYRSNAKLSQLLDAGYFDPVASELAFGDVLFVRTADAIAEIAVVHTTDSSVTVRQMSCANLPTKRSRAPSATEVRY